MSSTSLFRVASRAVRPSSFFRASQLPHRVQAPAPAVVAWSKPSFSTTTKRASAGHEDETYEEFSARYVDLLAIDCLVVVWRGLRSVFMSCMSCHGMTYLNNGLE